MLDRHNVRRRGHDQRCRPPASLRPSPARPATHRRDALAGAGESIYFVQQQLGHADIQTTIDQYGHPDNRRIETPPRGRRMVARGGIGAALRRRRSGRTSGLAGSLWIVHADPLKNLRSESGSERTCYPIRGPKDHHPNWTRNEKEPRRAVVVATRPSAAPAGTRVSRLTRESPVTGDSSIGIIGSLIKSATR